ncbi:E3 ubiquitin-protein ligase rnf8-B-like [Patiria miniata]|uniref:RING-type domain-containing protein n=1 Tax=Patiria miniata TaxID=46514 RepID=A0A914B6K2_PATMI|nr:E3 ubiquitin-protein ligase rnf8-B-like [Patiria miniata]
MAPTRRASCKVARFASSKSQPPGNATNKGREKLTSSKAGKPSGLDGSDTVRRTRSQSALRSRENVQLRINNDVCNKESHRGHARGPEAVEQASISGICFNKECQTRKDMKQKKSCSKAVKDTKKRKRCTRCTSGKSKKRLKGDIQTEDISVQEAVPPAPSQKIESRKSTPEVPAKPQVDSGENASQASPDGHLEIKTRIGLIRQRILEEQARVRGLGDQLARNKDTERASLSCRRIRIHKELKKLREKVQLEDKRRLQAKDHRIQRQLEAGKRKVDSERWSMRTRLAKEWRDRFQRRKSEVRRAKQSLKAQIGAHQVDKRELLKQLQKDWTAQLSRVQAMRERLEMEMVRGGQQWDGEMWRTGTMGKHKYSLRRAPREKTHVYCRAWKMANKKVSSEPKKQDEKPPSGGTVYKETKQKTLMELYQILDSELRCSICSELFISAVVLNCSHTFCSFCIKQWKRRTDRCPICRASITSRNPISKLDPFLTKLCRRVGREVEKKRAETIKDRQGQEKELKEGGRTWGNFASHSLEDWDMDDDDDFNGSLDSDDDSDVDEFLEILQDRVGGSAFRRFFGFGLVDDLEGMDDSDDDLFSSSDEDLDSDDFEDLDSAFLGEDDDDEDDMLL